jgi:hypothetical protein
MLSPDVDTIVKGMATFVESTPTVPQFTESVPARTVRLRAMSSYVGLVKSASASTHVIRPLVAFASWLHNGMLVSGFYL